MFCVCVALFPLLWPTFAGAGTRAYGTEAKLLTNFSALGSRWKAGGRGEQPGSQSWSESTAQLLLGCNTDTDLLLYSVTSMRETAIRLLKLEGAGETRSDGIHILKGAERILLLGEMFYEGT